MELLGLGVWFLLIYVISNAAQDLMHAWRGTENPRLKIKLAQARQAGRTRYGVRDYWADLWSDALEARTERRRQKVRDGQATADELLQPAVVPTPDLGPDPAPKPPTPESDPRQPAVEADEFTHRPWRPVVLQGGGGTESTEPAPAPDPEPSTSTKENEPVSAPAAEILGLDRSIAYAEDIAQSAADHGPAGGEGYIGHLQAGNVSGAAIATAQAMQQAAEALRAAAEAHAEELRKQKNVQEAYDQNPDAGSQDYVQQGR